MDWVLEKLVEIGVVRFREGEHGENKERKRDEGIEKNSGEQNNEVDEPGIDREQGEERIEERGINNKHSEQPFEA